MGRDPRARLGRRPGGHPGSGVGAHLPAGGRCRHDLLGRGGNRLLPTRLTAGEVEQVRRRNEERRASVLETFAAAGLDYVDVSSGDPVSIHAPSSGGRMRGSCTAEARMTGRLRSRSAPPGGGRRPRCARGRRRRGASLAPGLVGRRRRLGTHRSRPSSRRASSHRALPLRRPGRRDRQDRASTSCVRSTRRR
jgi:hypothetical protein